jgi:hypothetical protein
MDVTVIRNTNSADLRERLSRLEQLVDETPVCIKISPAMTLAIGEIKYELRRRKYLI